MLVTLVYQLLLNIFQLITKIFQLHSKAVNSFWKSFNGLGKLFNWFLKIYQIPKMLFDISSHSSFLITGLLLNACVLLLAFSKYVSAGTVMAQKLLVSTRATDRSPYANNEWIEKERVKTYVRPCQIWCPTMNRTSTSSWVDISDIDPLCPHSDVHCTSEMHRYNFPGRNTGDRSVETWLGMIEMQL